MDNIEQKRLNQLFLHACKNNDNEGIQKAILDGANINLVLWDDNTDVSFSVYSNYAIIHNDFSLLPFVAQHGFYFDTKSVFLLDHFAMTGDLHHIKMIESLGAKLLNPLHRWPSLAAQYQHSSILMYFWDLFKQPHYQQQFDQVQFSCLLSEMIDRNDITLLKDTFDKINHNSFLLDKLHHNTPSDSKYILEQDSLALLSYIEHAVFYSRIEILDYLLHDTSFNWPIPHEQIYGHVASYAVSCSSSSTCDYLWQIGYHFEPDDILKDKLTLIPFDKIMVGWEIENLGMNHVDIHDYIHSFYLKKKQKNYLDSSLPIQPEYIKPKI